MPRQVMIGYDGTEQSEDALALGAVLARALGAEALVAAVLPLPGHLLPGGDREKILGEHTAPVFARARERLGEIPVTTRGAVDESPARALQEMAEQEEPLVLVVGSTHGAPLGRVLTGTLGEALLAGAPCAIAVAPRGYAQRDERRLLRLGAAVDGSQESQAALDVAIRLARRLNAELTAVAVAEPPAPSYAETFAVLTAEQYESSVQKRMEAVLDHAAKRAPHDLPLHRRLLHGDPARAIADFAEDLDLLIVGSRGYGPLRRVLLGAVSAKLMRSSPCPLLVLVRGVAPGVFDLPGGGDGPAEAGGAEADGADAGGAEPG